MKYEKIIPQSIVSMEELLVFIYREPKLRKKTMQDLFRPKVKPNSYS